MKHDELVGWAGTSFGSILTILQTNEILQIVQGIFAIISLLLTIAYTIWKWYKKASKDGKITEEEFDELFDDLGNIKEEKDNDKSRK